MPRDRSYIPLLTEWNPGTRQRRTHRRLDETRELIARLALAPVGEDLPNVVQATGDFGALADQTITLNGDGFLNTSVQATCTTDAAGTGEIDWTILYPGAAGNDYTVTLTDLGAGGVFTYTWTVHDLVIGYDSTAVGVADTAALLLADLADYTTNPTEAGVLKGTDVGGGALTDVAETAFTGGTGAGEFAVDIDGTAQPITEWTDTQIVIIADLSTYSDGDIVPLLVIADGIEAPVQVRLSSTGTELRAARVGSGYFAIVPGGAGNVNNADAVTITDGTTLETYTFQAGAPANPGEVQTGGGGQASIDNLVAAIISDSGHVYAVSANAAGDPVCALVPRDITTAGNFTIAVTVGGARIQASAATMLGGSVEQPLLGLPLEYTVTANDAALWLNGDMTPIAVFPWASTTAPKLYSLIIDRAGDCFSPAQFQYLLEQEVTGDFWVLEFLDPAPATLNAGDLLRVIIGR
jgi:hypothetical protein